MVSFRSHTNQATRRQACSQEFVSLGGSGGSAQSGKILGSEGTTNLSLSEPQWP